MAMLYTPAMPATQHTYTYQALQLHLQKSTGWQWVHMCVHALLCTSKTYMQASLHCELYHAGGQTWQLSRRVVLNTKTPDSSGHQFAQACPRGWSVARLTF